MGSSTYVAATTVSFLSLKFNPSARNKIDTKQSLHCIVYTVLLYHYYSTIPGGSSLVGGIIEIQFCLSQCDGVEVLISSQ